MLDYDTRLAGYVVDTDRSKLGGASRFTASDRPDWSDREYTGRIDEYWIPPL